MKTGDETWHFVFERDRGICQYCGMDLLQNFEHYQMSSVDHIKPRCRGGGDEPDNLVLACQGCNTRLSRAHAHQTLESRREYLKSSSQGARACYAEYILKKSRGWG